MINASRYGQQEEVIEIQLTDNEKEMAEKIKVSINYLPIICTFEFVQLTQTSKQVTTVGKLQIIVN